MNIGMRGLKYLLVIGLLGVITGLNFNEQRYICAEPVGSVNTQENVIFSDDFENYQVGTYPSATWTNMYGGVSAEISSEQYYSPDRSFRLCAYSNWCRTDYVQVGYMDKFYYEAKVYADNKTVGIGFMISRGNYNPGFNMVRFNNDGNIYFGGQSIQSFSRKRWYTVRVYIDYTSLRADLYIDGVKKVENVEINPYSFYDDRWGDVVLDKFRLNVPNFDSGSGIAYFDDVLIVEISSAAKSSDIDTDGDNIPDDEDTCYNPGCSIVDSQGCPWDSTCSSEYSLSMYL
ncbi:MAG: hypothetical protein AYK19_17840 [Theionarchaea archaeon DG-70-1]|nr:MAG: hypothetical protein AYK19_17840 [Theionarchaea archaeon DG-70-1]